MTTEPNAIRMSINGTLMTATCTRPGCGWGTSFTPMISLAQIVDVSEQHQCRPQPCSACGHQEDA